MLNVLVLIFAVSLLAILWGLINLVYPFGKLRIKTRRDALVFIGVGFLVLTASVIVQAVIGAGETSDQASVEPIVATPGKAISGEYAWQAIHALAIFAAIWFFVNFIKPMASLGINDRYRALVLFCAAIAVVAVASSGRQYVIDGYIEGIRGGDKEVYLSEVKARLGEKEYWDALKEIDPERWSKLKSEQQSARAAEQATKKTEDKVTQAADAARDLKMKQDVWVVRGQEAVEGKLKDPGSAEFRNMFFSDGSGVPMSCGEVNSKNSFGGFTGFQRYVSAGSVDTTFLEEEVKDFDTLWNQMCLKKAKTSQSAPSTANNAPLADFYVVAESLNERDAPNGKVVNKIYRGQKLTVYQIKDGWALTTTPGFDQRWVSYEHLSKNKPAAATGSSSYARPDDPRFDPQAIGKPGEYGLTQKDVDILWRGAIKMLDSGTCRHIAYGDKSTSKANTYYVTCEGSRNVFFKESDL